MSQALTTQDSSLSPSYERRSRPRFFAGLAVGLLVGAGMLIGAVTAFRYQNSATQFPVQLLQATASHGGDTMGIATGPIAEGVEGLFILDYLTGRLQCMVINPRTGTLGGAFEYNVLRDLGAEQGKRKYLMVTGLVNPRTFGGSIKPADCAVYVADATSGAWAAYSLPWNRNAANVNFTQAAPMTLIGKGVVRDLGALME